MHDGGVHMICRCGAGRLSPSSGCSTGTIRTMYGKNVQCERSQLIVYICNNAIQLTHMRGNATTWTYIIGGRLRDVRLGAPQLTGDCLRTSHGYIRTSLKSRFTEDLRPAGNLSTRTADGSRRFGIVRNALETVCRRAKSMCVYCISQLLHYTLHGVNRHWYGPTCDRYSRSEERAARPTNCPPSQLTRSTSLC